MEEVLRAVWHDLDDSNGNKTLCLSPLALIHKACSSPSANLQGSLHGANAEIQAQKVTQVPEYVEQD